MKDDDIRVRSTFQCRPHETAYDIDERVNRMIFISMPLLCIPLHSSVSCMNTKPQMARMKSHISSYPPELRCIKLSIILQRIPIRVIAYPQGKKAKQKLETSQCGYVAAHPHSATAAAYRPLILSPVTGCRKSMVKCTGQASAGTRNALRLTFLII